MSAKSKNYSNGITSELPQATKENLARNAQRLLDERLKQQGNVFDWRRSVMDEVPRIKG